jgi:hypothetical protein
MESHFPTIENFIDYLMTFNVYELTPTEINFFCNYSHLECLSDGYCMAYSFLSDSIAMVFYISNEDFDQSHPAEIERHILNIPSRIQQSQQPERRREWASLTSEDYEDLSSSSFSEDESSSSESFGEEFHRHHIMVSEVNSEGEVDTRWRRRRADEYPEERVVVSDEQGTLRYWSRMANQGMTGQGVTIESVIEADPEPTEEDIEVFIHPTTDFS